MNGLEIFGWCVLAAMVPGGAILGTFMALDGTMDRWWEQSRLADKLIRLADWFDKIFERGNENG